MGEQVEKVMLPFEEASIEGASAAPVTDGALALTPANTPTINGAETAGRLADYAHSWGITVPAGFTPASKAQVAYWRELCGALLGDVQATTPSRGGL